MCGIFAYYNYRVARDRKAILEFLFTGLRRLEYRGYDSAGISIDGDVGRDTNSTIHANGSATNVHTPIVIKSSGKIDALVDLTFSELKEGSISLDTTLDSHAGIAHTRWATHGAPSAINSHPHVSGPGHEFVVVHNGIITNYRALRDFLIKHGETFVTDTDTEVIPKLCNYVYSNLAAEEKEPLQFSELIMEVMTQLEGAYSLLIKSTHYPGELVACKRGSPLILGIKELPYRTSSTALTSTTEIRKRPAGEAFEAFLASDASAVVEHTKKVIVLEDNDVVHLCKGTYGIFNTRMSDKKLAVPRVLQTLEMELTQIMKGGYQHYMQKEIHEQPDSIQQTMRGRVNFSPGSPHLGSGFAPSMKGRITLGGLSDHLATIRRGRRILFMACGTSFHACLACRQIVEELTEMPVALELASDFMDRRCPIFRDDMCVFVSQSGETADTLQALMYAKDSGALCIGVTNTVGSAIARATHCGVHINAGCEIGVASTKAYTSQMVTIIMMALALSEDSLSKRMKREAIIDGLGRLPDQLRKVLKLDQQMQQLAEKLKKEDSLLVFGRGYNYATALEAALKVKEVALMHSEGILAGEMKHGPLALVDDSMPIIAIATRDRMHSKMHSILQQLRARHARLIIVCNESDDSIEELCAAAPEQCQLIQVPQAEDCIQPIINIVPLQLLSYHLTLLRGHNVDQPRNLAKSVTVTEEE